jgi:penicillin amidase
MTDDLGVPHIYAGSDHDVFFMQGYVHARDRFFQMDASRRVASGTLAELTGSDTDLQADALARLLGLRRAAERSLALVEPAELALLQAYADGVNAWLHRTPSLPPEYADLEITTVPDWTPLDSLAIGQWTMSERLDLWQIAETTALESYVAALGDEAGEALYFEDLARFAPWVQNATIPDATGATLAAARSSRDLGERRVSAAAGTPRRLDARRLSAAAAAARPLATRAQPGTMLARALAWKEVDLGSNAWGVASSKSASGRPLVAADAHVPLATPAFGYEIHLVGSDAHLGALNVTGASEPGIPGIFHGQNERIAFDDAGAYHDVTDVFRDRLLRGDPACPARLCIASEGALHPVEEQPQTYRRNQLDGIPDDPVDATAEVDDPHAVDLLVVPFRSFGPVLSAEDPSVLGDGPPGETGVLTLQSTLLHAMRAARVGVGVLRARDVFAFGALVRGSSLMANWVVADGDGNLAFYTTADVPLRADLEAGALVGLPPFLIRDGSGPNNWVPDPARSQGQAVPFALVPPEEMPHVVNPPAGFVVNGTEDASGFVLDNDLLNQQRPSSPGAIHYLGAKPVRGLRNGRVTALLRAKIDAGELLSLDDMRRFQGDTVALHAELLTPHLVSALASAQRPGAPAALATLAADARVVEAVGRLAAWDFSNPTGIEEGYDAADEDGVRAPPSGEEVGRSVAAAIYNVWFFKLLNRFSLAPTLLGVTPRRSGYALLHLLGQDPFTGVGASGVDFFPTPTGLSSADRRDVMLLGALRDALNALAGASYAAAFGRSTNQQDYRWGRLHRIVLPHRLGSAYSIPPAGGYADLSPALPGLAKGGTWDSVDTSDWPALGDGANAFVANWGPSWRIVRSPVGAAGVEGFSAFLGGSSGNPASPLYASRLGHWLTSDYHPVLVTTADVVARTTRLESFAPAQASNAPAPEGG